MEKENKNLIKGLTPDFWVKEKKIMKNLVLCHLRFRFYIPMMGTGKLESKET